MILQFLYAEKKNDWDERNQNVVVWSAKGNNFNNRNRFRKDLLRTFFYGKRNISCRIFILLNYTLFEKYIYNKKKKNFCSLKVCIGIVSEIEASNDLFLLSVTSWNVLHHCHFPRRKHINFSGYEDHAKPIFMVMFEFFLVNLSAYLT